MGARWSAWMTRIDALSLRERAILLLVVLLVLFLLGDQLFISPNLTRIQQERQALTELRGKLASLQIRTEQLGTGRTDPLESRKQRIAELEQAVSEQSRRFEAHLGKLVHPQKAAQLLGDILRQDAGLRLLNLDTSPGAALLDSNSGAARIVRYDLDLRVEGGYLAVLDYLQRLEDLPWTLIWSDFKLQVVQHPTCVAQLTMYTLGQRI